jgi:uncharacterized membrane protein
MVLHLIYAEAFQIYKVCLWCTGIHAVTLALFLIVLLNTPKEVVKGGEPPATTQSNEQRAAELPSS